MSKLTILAILIIVFIICFVIFIFPGVFPIRAFEGVFGSVCDNIMQGEFNAVQSTDFVGLAGAPIRKDYVECGVVPAIDANKICYVAPNPRPSFLSTNPLGKSSVDNCDLCQFGEEKIKDCKFLMGKRCKQYKYIWRWEYRTNF